ncbi:MAG: hypothetical protein ABSE41_04215 [Bacteroidota bacterium]
MYERCLNEAERILASDKDVIVPVKKIWEAVDKQRKKQGFEIPSLPDFTALLEGDARFEFMPSLDENGDPMDGSQRDDADPQEELETLGFYSGDRVKLRSVELTPETLGGLIRRKVDMTMDALTKAWERRPEGDQDAEDQLLDILAKTQKLQREVKSTFSPERMKELEAVLSQAKKKVVAPKTKKPTAKKKAARKSPAKKKPRPTATKPRAKKPASPPKFKRPPRT